MYFILFNPFLFYLVRPPFPKHYKGVQTLFALATGAKLLRCDPINTERKRLSDEESVASEKRKKLSR